MMSMGQAESREWIQSDLLKGIVGRLKGKKYVQGEFENQHYEVCECTLNGDPSVCYAIKGFYDHSIKRYLLTLYINNDGSLSSQSGFLNPDMANRGVLTEDFALTVVQNFKNVPSLIAPKEEDFKMKL